MWHPAHEPPVPEEARLGDTWRIELAPSAARPRQEDEGQLAGPVVADLVWAALGSRYNVMDDAVLRGLQVTALNER